MKGPKAVMLIYRILRAVKTTLNRTKYSTRAHLERYRSASFENASYRRSIAVFSGNMLTPLKFISFINFSNHSSPSGRRTFIRRTHPVAQTNVLSRRYKGMTYGKLGRCNKCNA